MKRWISKGFTVLELLIVVAIIGLLASVIVVALGQSRGSATDAAIKETMSQIRTQALLYYDSHGQAFCDPVPCDAGAIVHASNCSALNSVFWDHASNEFSINPLVLAAAKLYDPVDQDDALCSLDANGQRWSVDMPLLKAGEYWCVDYTGTSKSGQDANGDGQCD